MDLTNFLKTARSERHGDSALQGAIEVICLLGRFASASDLRKVCICIAVFFHSKMETWHS
jgi:hypothetical protein